ncbi:hypothetical protein [Caldicellulosiruptor changbaiensis]|nr:hypothetical protein [Caldicellulosiruptor changbaiensis]
MKKQPIKYDRTRAIDKRGISIGARRIRIIIPKITPMQNTAFLLI